MPHVLDSFARMKAAVDIVLVEGAGSASETNLRTNDIANMGFAEAAGGTGGSSSPTSTGRGGDRQPPSGQNTW